jgi:nicotinamide-nucleotide amidase
MPTETKPVEKLADLLRTRSLRVVLAESCTCGSAAAALGLIPGISDHFCGSIVSYRNAAKIDWLRVAAVDIARSTAVCEKVAEQMALHVLEMTLEADYAASITGHLDDVAVEGLGGVVFIGRARRHHGKLESSPAVRRQLTASGRQARQEEATDLLLAELCTSIIQAG